MSVNLGNKILFVLGTLIVLSVYSNGLTGIQNYRDILNEYPNYDLILLTNDTVDRLELLGRSYSEHEEFYRWSFKDGKVKTYIASDLIDISYWQLFQGTKQIYFNEKSPLDYVYDANSAKIIIGIDYFMDSRHTNYVGRLEREIEVYPNKNKETIKWYPKNKTIKYNFQWVHETDHLGESKNLKGEYKTDLDKLQINWNDSIDKVSASRQYLNGKVKVRYTSAYGDQIIDPIVKIGGTTVTYDRYDGLGGISYTPECFIGEVCHLPLSITLSKNFVVTDKAQLSKRFKNKHGIDIILPTSGVNIWGDVNKTIQNWTNETCIDYSEYLYDSGNETWYWNNWTECIGGYFEEINETVQAWKSLELPLSINKDVPIYIDIYGIKNSTDAVDALGLILGYTTYEFAWWNSSWDFKKEIQIDGIGDEIPANYQFKIEIDYESAMNDTFKDIRFTWLNSSTEQEIDYWIESNYSQDNATVWFEVPEISNTSNETIYMYYGNPTATSESNGTNTFEDYQDKDSTSGWTTNGGLTVTTSGDYLRFYNSVYANVGYAEKSIDVTPTKYIMETYFKTISLDTNDHGGVGLLDNTVLMSWGASPFSTSQATWQYYRAGIGWSSIGSYTEGTEYIRKLIVNETDSTTGLDYILQNTERTTINSATSIRFSTTTATDVDILRFGDSTGGGKCDLYVKWNIIRKYTATEPTYSIGAEESSNTAPTVTANSTSPATIYSNTDTTANLTVTDPEADTLTAYIQHYVNDSAVGDVVSTVVTNNTNTLVATLGNGNYSSGDNITTEYWAGDGTINTTKANMTDTVQSQFTITLNNPVDEYNSSDNTTDFNFTVSGIDDSYSCELFLNDTGYGTNTTTLNNTETIITANSSVNDGYYDWNINCTAGITTNTSEIRQITIDTVKPTITVYSPTNTTYDSLTVNLTVSADEDIATWIYTLNGGNWIGFTPNTTFTAIVGINNITIAAYDYASNTNTSSTIYFTVDSCSCPVSGNWAIDCADNCVLTSCDMQTNNFTITGTGTVFGFANIYNYVDGYISGDCIIRE